MASASVGDCLSGARDTFKKNVLTHVVCTLLVMVVAGISAGLLAGPMMVGYMRMIERETRGEAVQIGDVFRGFDDFVPAFVAGLISSLVVSLGFMLCFIPGLLVMALPPVALFLVARGERDGVAAFSQAWSIVTKNLGSAFFCSLVLGIVGSLGFLLCWVGPRCGAGRPMVHSLRAPGWCIELVYQLARTCTNRAHRASCLAARRRLNCSSSCRRCTTEIGLSLFVRTKTRPRPGVPARAGFAFW